MVTVWGDRPGGTDAKAFGTADLFGATVGAQQRLSFYVKRLFKRTDHLRGVKDHFCHRCWAAGIGLQIAIALFMRWEKWCSAG